MEILNTHSCINVPNNVKIFSMPEGKVFPLISWFLEIGSEKIEIQHCPFCDTDLPVDRIYLYGEGPDGKEHFVQGNGFQKLWDSGILYEVPIKFKDEEGKEIRTIAVVINCNDLFWWGCADFEFLSYDDIQSLYEHCFDKEGNIIGWGSTIWACLKRGMRPQHPIEEMMKKEGAWTPDLEALPVREFTG